MEIPSVVRGERSVADVISLALNPSVWGGGFLVFLAVTFEPPGIGRWIAAAVGFLSVAVLPVVILFVLKHLGVLRDVEMRRREDRSVMYLSCAGSYVLGAATLATLGSSWQLWGLVGLHVPSALSLAGLNRWWKVSIHAAGLAGILAAAVVFFGLRGMPLAVVLLFGVWARWAAGAHTRGELLGGTLVGLALTGGGLILLRAMIG